jgi:hypothetical protein
VVFAVIFFNSLEYNDEVVLSVTSSIVFKKILFKNLKICTLKYNKSIIEAALDEKKEVGSRGDRRAN